MSPFCYLPTKLEEFSVVRRRLTEQELKHVVSEVYDLSLIWHEEPRSWLTYGGFLGMHIGRAQLQYQIGVYHDDADEARQEINDFVEACHNYALANGETL